MHLSQYFLNKKEVNFVELCVPGGFNATEVNGRIQQELKSKKGKLTALLPGPNLTLEEPFQLYRYYISRFQVWASTKTANARCRGSYLLSF